ncbi:hypothetical protein VNO77_42994 [Canavalia gladiata]|uniref:Disease resistance protein At4g27190-like leucine-rich repeats domain-containing protein n=1 Tax=Canavalia gladiata TaxID=3824 RepID=A0AAN9JWW9_CANGL
MQIPDSFFEETQLLKVLVLNKFDCSKLPSSLSLLNHLEALSIYNCKFEDVNMIGDLANLRMLVFLESTIQRFPKQIRKLQKLLFLDLKDTYFQVIPPNVLSNLTSLEEIYLRNSFYNWQVERSNNENKNASLKELTNLHHLVCVKELCVPDPQAWPMDLFFEKLKSYTILIGDRWGQTHDGDHRLKILKLKLDRRFHLANGIKQMMKNVDVLYLDELNGVQNIGDLDDNGFPYLRSLVVQYNAEVKYVAKMSDHALDTFFSNLDSISLLNLANFEYICHGPLIGKSFFNVRVINIQECNGMKCLFSTSMIKGLPHLADMEVSDCKLLEAIVLVEGGENPHMDFAELSSLTLRGLPALISFCINKETSYIDTSTLFQDQVSCPELENMVISNAKKLIMIWNENYDAPNSFWKLKNVSITGFQLPKLEYVCVGFGLEVLKEKLEEERKKEASKEIREKERMEVEAEDTNMFIKHATQRILQKAEGRSIEDEGINKDAEKFSNFIQRVRQVFLEDRNKMKTNSQILFNA